MGEMKFVAYDQSNGRRVIVATEENVLASINTRNGEISNVTSAI